MDVAWLTTNLHLVPHPHTFYCSGAQTGKTLRCLSRSEVEEREYYTSRSDVLPVHVASMEGGEL